MTNALPSHTQQWLRTPALTRLFNALEQQARVVGGCVRNSLLNQPVTDIDIATPLPPKAVMEQLIHAKIRVLPTGLNHGTVTAIIDHQPYEITTLRHDLNCDGRHAKVTFTDSWEEDAARRDLTINALSCDQDGTLYDYYNGQQDLTQGLIRFVGVPIERCQEDYLRILRLFRFYAYYGKQIDPESLKACAACKDQLWNLSGERIHHELYKLLNAPAPLAALEQMHTHGILEVLFGETPSLKRLTHLLQLEQQLNCAPQPLRRLVALLLELTHISEELLQKLRLSNQQKYYCQTLLHTTFPSTRAQQKSCIRKINNLEISQDLVLLAWSAQPENSQFQDDWTFVNEWPIPTFPLKGQDLLDHGIKPGKQVGQLLEQAEQWWESNDYIATKDELLLYATETLNHN